MFTVVCNKNLGELNYISLTKRVRKVTPLCNHKNYTAGNVNEFLRSRWAGKISLSTPSITRPFRILRFQENVRLFVTILRLLRSFKLRHTSETWAYVFQTFSFLYEAIYSRGRSNFYSGNEIYDNITPHVTFTNVAALRCIYVNTSCWSNNNEVLRTWFVWL